jgi:hypothetical protein
MSDYQANFVKHPVDTQAIKQAHEQKLELRKSHFVLSCSPPEKLTSTMRGDIGVFKEDPQPPQKQGSMNRHRRTSIQFGYGVPVDKIQSESRAWFVKHPPASRSAVKQPLTNPAIIFGFDQPDYQSTSSFALAQGQSDPSARPGVLAASVKADLRKAHFKMGDVGNEVWSTTARDMQQPHGLCRAELDPSMKKDLRASHFSTAADSTADAAERRISLSHASYSWPKRI